MNDGPVAPPTPARPSVVCVFVASFEGVCRECADDIWPGQRIAELTSGAYVHEGCA